MYCYLMSGNVRNHLEMYGGLVGLARPPSIVMSPWTVLKVAQRPWQHPTFRVFLESKKSKELKKSKKSKS